MFQHDPATVTFRYPSASAGPNRVSAGSSWLERLVYGRQDAIYVTQHWIFTPRSSGVRAYGRHY